MKRVVPKALWLAAVAAGVAACATGPTLKKSDQDAVSRRYSGKRMFLRSSMHYGQFFGDRKSYLIASRRFSELRLIEGLDGLPIPPGKEDGTIPAGREAEIERIEFPPAERPLLTPRFYPWVYLKVDKTFTDRPHILVLQPNVETAAEFEQLLGLYLVERDPRPAIEARGAEIRKAIDAKNVVEGMNEDALVASMGAPDEIRRGADGGAGGGRADLWVYAKRCVKVKDGAVVGYSEDGCR
ncbi:MAG: hypothetical protein HY897_11940 [Deltaproteobacteria bacterium]|nr:hypothetical protein [Deltaproteobacteria bacterium]